MTPHNSAKKQDIAKTVLMPGDPLRAKLISEHFLTDAKLVQSVRGMYAYTGKYKGIDITVMAHGMGIPSIGIYSYELYKFYDVENIIRIGSAGSYDKNLKINEIVLVNESYSESTYANLMFSQKNINLLNPPNNKINDLILKTAKENDISLTVGRCHSSDIFYKQEPLEQIIKRSKALCVEMESFGLFTNAKLLNKNAATLLTISDSLITNESLSSEERQNTFIKMINLALETAIKLK